MDDSNGIKNDIDGVDNSDNDDHNSYIDDNIVEIHNIVFSLIDMFKVFITEEEACSGKNTPKNQLSFM